MSSLDQWVARSLRRLHFGRFLQTAADWLALFLFVFGGAVLVVKLLAPSGWPHVLWIAAAALPVTAAAWLVSRQVRYTRTESVALLDRKLQTGGLLMMLAEQPHDAWQARLPQVEAAWSNSLPQVRPVRFAKTLSGPLLFAVAACFVPLRVIPAEPSQPNLVGRTASRQLEETLAALEEAKVLEPEEQEKVRQEIEKLADESRSQPLTHEKWETVDSLRERLKLRLDTADLAASKGRNAVDSLRNAMKEDGLKINPDQTAALEQEALETLRKMQKRGALPSQRGQKPNNSALERLMKNGKFSENAAERQEELDALDDFLKEESERLGKCRGKCRGEGEGECEGDGEGDQDGPDGDGRPGRGGVNRGRGDAKLTYGDESTEDGTKFKEIALPPGFLDQPGNEVVEVTPAAPDVDPAASAPRNRRNTTDSASGNEAVQRQLRPRHKSVVKQYFDGK